MANIKKITLIQLNELDFAVVQRYLDRGESLPAFESIVPHLLQTTSEHTYDELEPWIQWPSIYTGLTARDHGIFRLGDCVLSEHRQIFELLEESGVLVGAVAPMNARNELEAPAFFLPDPWTDTDSDKSMFSRLVTRALRQVVNDNAGGRIRVSSFLILAIASLVGVRFGLKLRILKLMAKVKTKPWYKALILDQLLAAWHEWLVESRRPGFSSVFLNAGAHIQHHYFLSCDVIDRKRNANPSWYITEDEDPILDMLKVYDPIIGDALQSGRDIILVTGLCQRPCEEPTFYYRLSDHEEFLRELGIDGARVSPRMTRDFLISFDNPVQASAAATILESLVDADDTAYFGVIENRGEQLFCTLTYPKQIRDEAISVGGKKIRIGNYVDFVAIKNGEHTGTGFLYCSPGVSSSFADLDHVKNVQKVILENYGVSSAALTD